VALAFTSSYKFRRTTQCCKHSYVWILHPVACIIRIVGNTVPQNNFYSCSFLLFLTAATCFSLFCPSSGGIYNLVFGNYYSNNGSVVLSSIESVVRIIISKTQKLYIQPEDGKIKIETCSGSDK
jgi:hypothetical protein